MEPGDVFAGTTAAREQPSEEQQEPIEKKKLCKVVQPATIFINKTCYRKQLLGGRNELRSVFREMSFRFKGKDTPLGPNTKKYKDTITKVLNQPNTSREMRKLIGKPTEGAIWTNHGDEVTVEDDPKATKFSVKPDCSHAPTGPSYLIHSHPADGFWKPSDRDLATLCPGVTEIVAVVAAENEEYYFEECTYYNKIPAQIEDTLSPNLFTPVKWKSPSFAPQMKSLITATVRSTINGIARSMPTGPR
jgi:hypothetical protein